MEGPFCCNNRFFTHPSCFAQPLLLAPKIEADLIGWKAGVKGYQQLILDIPSTHFQLALQFPSLTMIILPTALQYILCRYIPYSWLFLSPSPVHPHLSSSSHTISAPVVFSEWVLNISWLTDRLSVGYSSQLA